MHRLVLDDLLEQRRRRVPGQPLRGSESRRRTRWRAGGGSRHRAPCRRGSSPVSASRSARMSTRNSMPSGKALNLVSSRIPGRDQGAAQRALGRQLVRLVGGRPDSARSPARPRPARPRTRCARSSKKRARPVAAEAEIDRGDARRLRPRQHLAAARRQAGAHLGAQPVRPAPAGRSGSSPPPNGSSAPAAMSRSARLQRPSVRPTSESQLGSARRARVRRRGRQRGGQVAAAGRALRSWRESSAGDGGGSRIGRRVRP